MSGAKSSMMATVLIANHNYGKWIDKAIESVIHQNYDLKNICVIDDGSTDNSKEILDSIVKHKKSIESKIYEEVYHGFTEFPSIEIICIFNKEAKGPSYARNQGIKATANFTDVWFVLDADDEMYPGKISKFMKRFEDPNIGIVYADYDTYGDDGVLVRNYKEPFNKVRLHQECIVHSGAAFSKEALNRAKISLDFTFDETMRTAEDWDLWLKIARASIGYHIPESLTKVRIHGNNATNSVHSEVWQQNWQKIRERLQNGTY